MKRYVCIHGHFYQPPRENPWLEEVENQDSAYPYHDWNQRITAECYAPNAASRILDRDRRIIDIVNNYSKISFNFGPTLLSWLQRQAPQVYEALLEADQASQQRFSGHGSALAQVYNHLIMPLANTRDKRTQIIWGIRDFTSRFNRPPEGMWLAETAVDLETLDLLAEQGIKFTILAPRQARQVRPINSHHWQDVSGERIETKRAYLCRLPSGRTIALFFYDGPISREIAFGSLLNQGECFASRLSSSFTGGQDGPLLVNIATDGETYGHHHRFGEMALSYCLYHIETHQLAELTIYGEYLEKYPPADEVEILENSSWSCDHGIERWRADCGCHSGQKPGWRQSWRVGLRQAMDWLRDQLAEIFEQQMSGLVSDPWVARDDYIAIMLDRLEPKIREFLCQRAGRELAWPEQVKARQLLEMQRHALLMFTSCGWFFDDLSGIETIQIILYAAAAIQLAKITSGRDLEPEYLRLLEQAKSNLPELPNGAAIYRQFARKEAVDLPRVGAHYALSSLYEDYPPNTSLLCYWVDQLSFERLTKKDRKAAFGRIHVYSSITAEETDLCFAAVQLSGEEIFGGVQVCRQPKDFDPVWQHLKNAFLKDGSALLLPLIDKYFCEHKYSLWHLFKDEQRKILNLLAVPGLIQVKAALREIFDEQAATMRGMNKLNMPLPPALYTTARFVFNDSLRTLLEAEEFDLSCFILHVKEVSQWPVKLDKKTLHYHATKVVNKLMARFFSLPENQRWLDNLILALKTFVAPPLELPLDLWQAQNLYFKTGKKLFRPMQQRSAESPDAGAWVDKFLALGKYLQVRIP